MQILTVFAALAAVLPQQQRDFQTDTTFTVPASTRLSLANAGGEVTIRTWDRNQVRVQATHSSRLTVEINLTGSALRLQTRSIRGFGAMMGMVDYVLTVPAGMGIDIGGMFADVLIEGTRADVKVNTVEGNVTIRGGGDRLSLTTINGAIVVEGARGLVEARSVSDDVRISDVQGDVMAESVSGDVLLARINGRRVEAASVSGNLTLEGPLRSDGVYSLTTHSGNITAAVQEDASALIRTSVGSGSVRASFALPASERATTRRQVFRFGAGSATVELETFSGNIRLVRPGEVVTPRTRRNQSNQEE